MKAPRTTPPGDHDDGAGSASRGGTDDPASEEAHLSVPDGIDQQRILELIARLEDIVTELGWGTVLGVLSDLFRAREQSSPGATKGRFFSGRGD